MRPLIRKIHKYLSLFVSIQLLLWTVSGIYFAYNKIELVRGEHLRNQSIEELSFDLTDLPEIQAKSINIFMRMDQPIIKINTINSSVPNNVKIFPEDFVSLKVSAKVDLQVAIN